MSSVGNSTVSDNLPSIRVSRPEGSSNEGHLTMLEVKHVDNALSVLFTLVSYG